MSLMMAMMGSIGGGGVPVVDKSALLAALNSAASLDENEYTPASWADLDSAVDTGQIVYDDVDASQSEVDDATIAINTAIAGLIVSNLIRASYVSPTTAAGLTISVPIPASAKAGDTLLVLVHIRADRTATFPTGWDDILSSSIPPSTSASLRTRFYLRKRVHDGSATSFTVTQSTNSPYSVTLLVLKGDTGAHSASYSITTLSHTKQYETSSMLVFSMFQDAPEGQPTTPRVTNPAGYIGVSYAHVISGGLDLYSTYTDTKAREPAGVINYTIDPQSGVIAARIGIVALEILQPTPLVF